MRQAADDRTLRACPTTALLAALAVAAAGSVAAQTVSPGGIGDPGSARQPLPELLPAPPPRAPEFVLPPLPPTQPPGPSRRGPRTFVRDILVSGSTVLSDEAIAAIVQPFLSRELTADDLEDLRRRLTAAYIERGYINSGAVLPDQDVVDGTVRYEIVEGRLTGIEVTGNERLRPAYVERRLERGAGPPLNVGDLERRLRILLQDPVIERMNLELLPGIEPGEARLRAEVVEANPYSLSAAIGNTQPPNVGPIKGELAGVVRNLTGWGDALALQYGRTRGTNDGGIAWGIPVTADDTLLTLRWDHDDAEVVTDSFRALDITSRTDTYEIGLTHPVYRTPEQTLTLGLSFAWRDSETELLGERFSFTSGVVDGRTRLAVLRFSQDWLSRGPEEVLALRSTFSVGLDAFGATNSGQKPDSQFFTWLGQAQYVRQLERDWQVILRSDVQLAGDPLFPLEQIAIGGLSTVRGYRENLLVRDNAIIASLEGRYAVARFDMPWWGNAPAQASVIQIAPFFDFGRGWNKRQPTPSPRDISSIGVGLRWDIGDVLAAQLYYGHPLRNIRVPDHDWQDIGIHFRITTRLY
jgi:hemolysin activation/secretion protein